MQEDSETKATQNESEYIYKENKYINTNKMCEVLLYLKNYKYHISYKKKITTNIVCVKSLITQTTAVKRHSTTVCIEILCISQIHSFEYDPQTLSNKTICAHREKRPQRQRKRQKETGEKPSHLKGVLSKLKEINSDCFSGKWMFHTCHSTATAHNTCPLCVLMAGLW